MFFQCETNDLKLPSFCLNSKPHSKSVPVDTLILSMKTGPFTAVRPATSTTPIHQATIDRWERQHICHYMGKSNAFYFIILTASCVKTIWIVLQSNLILSDLKSHCCLINSLCAVDFNISLMADLLCDYELIPIKHHTLRGVMKVFFLLFFEGAKMIYEIMFTTKQIVTSNNAQTAPYQYLQI